MKKGHVLPFILGTALLTLILQGCGNVQETGNVDERENDETAVLTETVEDLEEGAAVSEAPDEETIAGLYRQEGYQLLWHDEFDGEELNTDIWTVELRDPGWTNNEMQAYVDTPDNVYVENGTLVLRALKGKGDNGLTAYTSGKVNSKSKAQFTYGKVVARAKVPAGQGLWPAIWMMPQDESFYGQWPKCGEIDIMEILGNQTNTMYSNIHYGLPHGENQGTYKLSEGAFSDEFHEFSVEWEPDEMRFFIDGKLFHTVNSWYTQVEGEDAVTYPAPFDQPFFVQMNLAVGGDWPGKPDGTTNFDNAKFEIDYVRVYQKDAYNEDVENPLTALGSADETGNFVRNGNYAVAEDLDDLVDWNFLLFEGGSGSASIENNELIISSTAAGNQEYSVQLVQRDIPMEQGGIYQVTFEALAEEAREMKVAVTAPEKSWIRYLQDTSLTMTPEWQAYTFTFTMENENDAKGRLEFNMGNQGSTATIHIRNVRIERIGTAEVEAADDAKSIQSDGNYVYNGTFQYGDKRLKYWDIDNRIDGAVVDVTNEKLVRRLHVAVPADAISEETAAKDITVTQSDLALVPDTVFNLTFDALGDGEQTIVTTIGGNTFETKLSAQLESYSYTFTLQDAAGKALSFYLGVPGNVYIDNVKVKEDGSIINGSFANGFTGWEPFVDNSLVDEVTYAVDSLDEEDAAGYTIRNTGEQNWLIQLMQKNISLYKGKHYRLSFDARSTIDRSIECAAQRDGSQDDVWTEYGKSSFALTEAYQTFTLEFDMSEENNPAAMITFSMGAIDGVSIEEEHVVYIDNVVLEEQ
ncbi:MAG: family 16 glycosylhydrolase [Lachnospiraceae bacterium]|nr:family 16 glycosylhydrolase [Lachnospiraceae bacterium]